MIACPSCGQENPEGFRFCGACGAELTAEPEPAREVRKTVTVLFCDLAGYTSKGESLDPEALRRVQSRYFEDARAALERHGGTVEKFIGDAVMAVFGIPQLHEDDALRALRAAVELREAVAGLELQARIGVNTGEVVAGSGEALVTGDAVNVAARLEQAASPGEILIGEETWRLTRDAIEAEKGAPLALKGKSEPVASYRLFEVRSDAPAFARRLDASMVGREDELAQLRQAFARSERERRCHLFTVLGAAGVGKSRLSHELVAALGDEARVLSGRCLSYGEGITYWPLVEIFRGAGAEQELDSALSAAVVEETFLAVRRFLEELARERPLVVVLDDLHWAEPTFLDLVDHVADWSRDAPILLVCLARPELLEARPAWGGGKVNASTILLEPLAEDECDALIDALLVASLPDDVRRRIVETADGNPLFVEQMLAMIIEGGHSEVAIPPTIQALIAARLDGLPPDERQTIERASVAGREFERAALAELAAEGPALDACLLGLVRKELIQPQVGGDGFRFAHQLVRDAAYEAMPKELRAELHGRFAAWLEERSPDLLELDEILGYHLEQAFRYRAELGPADDRALELRAAASRRLAVSGERALSRGDMPAAAGLLDRAMALLEPDDEARLRLLPLLGHALLEAGELARAEAVFADAGEAAERAGDRGLEASVVVHQIRLRMMTDPHTPFAAAQGPLRAAAETFEELGDEAGLARASRMLALLDFWHGSAAQAGGAFERAAEHARRAGDRRLELDCLEWINSCLLYGPAPAKEAIRKSEMIERVAGDRRVEAWARTARCVLEAMLGNFDKARQLREQARATMEDLGMRLELAGSTQNFGWVELLAGDSAAAEREFRASYELSERMGETGYLSTTAGFLAEALYAQGRYDEALRYTKEGERAAAADDVVSQILWRAVRARVLACKGEPEPAEQLAREAVALADSTDRLDHRGAVHLALTEVLRLAGRESEAAAEAQESLRLYEEKGNVVSAERARALLVELRGNQPPATA